MIEGEYRVRVVFRADGFARVAGCADFFTARLLAAGRRILQREEERGEDETN
jgi:hypothetical protein